MARQRQSIASNRLNQLRERIEHWRLTRVKRRRMPAAFWDEAATLARELGLHPVKSTLGLNYESLRRRVNEEDTACAGVARAGTGGNGGQDFCFGYGIAITNKLVVIHGIGHPAAITISKSKYYK